MRTALKQSASLEQPLDEDALRRLDSPRMHPAVQAAEARVHAAHDVVKDAEAALERGREDGHSPLKMEILADAVFEARRDQRRAEAACIETVDAVKAEMVAAWSPEMDRLACKLADRLQGVVDEELADVVELFNTVKDKVGDQHVIRASWVEYLPQYLLKNNSNSSAFSMWVDFHKREGRLRDFHQ